MYKVMLFTVMLLLSGCSSIPLSTMLEMRSYGKEDFLATQPEHLRAQVLLSQPVRANLDEVQLKLALETSKGSRLYQFPLQLLAEEQVPAASGLFSATPAKNSYTFKLSEQAIANFVEMQQLLAEQTSGKFNFTISSGLLDVPQGASSVTLTARLKLSEQHDYLTLFENAKLTLDHSD
jgi:hypothetical protein